MVEFVSNNNRRLAMLLDFALVLIAFYLAFQSTFLITQRYPFANVSYLFFQTYLINVASWILTLLLFSEYPVRRLTEPVREAWIAIRMNLFAFLIFTTIAFAVKEQGVSRSFVCFDFLITLSLMILSRLLVRVFLYLRRRSGVDIKTRIIVGIGEIAMRYVVALESHPQLGLRIIGYVSDTKGGTIIPYLGKIKDFSSILRKYLIDGVVICLPVSDPSTKKIVQACEVQGVMVELVIDGLSSRLANSQIVHGMGIPRIALHQVPHSAEELLLKRITDIIVSTVVILLLLPVFLIIMLAIKLDDGGPVFFRQRRAGLHGRSFWIHKFRSMQVNAEQMRNKLMHLNEMSGPVFKVQNDPRVTRVGKWLRKTSLDELPQLIDVFIGHMSLVGPRPPLLTEVDQYDPEYRRRLSVKPGITCLWQISGRNNIDFDEWMNLDLRYIDNWSYMSDIKILIKTIPAVIRRNGAS